MKPKTAPMITASILSRRLRMNGRSLALMPRLMNDFARKPSAAGDERAADRVALDRLRAVAVVVLDQVATPTPASESGPEPRNIQSVSRACTVPSRRWRIAPNDLKIAPCRMSVPTA